MPNNSFLYILSDSKSDSNHLKIGHHSGTIHQLIERYRTPLPKVNVWLFYQHDHASAIERILLKDLHSYRYHNSEWLEITLNKLLGHVLQTITRYNQDLESSKVIAQAPGKVKTTPPSEPIKQTQNYSSLASYILPNSIRNIWSSNAPVQTADQTCLAVKSTNVPVQVADKGLVTKTGNNVPVQTAGKTHVVKTTTVVPVQTADKTCLPAKTTHVPVHTADNLGISSARTPRPKKVPIMSSESHIWQIPELATLAQRYVEICTQMLASQVRVVGNIYEWYENNQWLSCSEENLAGRLSTRLLERYSPYLEKQRKLLEQCKEDTRKIEFENFTMLLTRPTGCKATWNKIKTNLLHLTEERLRQEQITNFLREKCQRQGQIPLSVLYGAYEETYREKAQSKVLFSRAIKQFLMLEGKTEKEITKHTTQGLCFIGLSLK